MAVNNVLGLDVGQSRTGVARANLTAKLPEPLETIETPAAFERIPAIIRQFDIGAVVVGLPRSLDGNETNQTAWVRQWAAGLKNIIPAPLYWQDEAVTSVLAEEYIRTHNVSRQLADAVAACILLQDFLQLPSQQWPRYAL